MSAPPVSFVLPTRNRPERLAQTLGALALLPRRGGFEAEVVVVDNASDPPARVPATLPGGMPVRLVRRERNEGASSRNAGAAAADPASRWIVMLDDDSYPVDAGFVGRLAAMGPDVAAVTADIFLPGLACRESGGLPEVWVGCGVAIRREVFEEVGGYDPAFGYYAEEYDLAARVLLAGGRVEFDPWFRVEHHKVAQQRDMDLIVSRLVRNNGWVMQRYAPEEERRERLRETRSRYRGIARKERAMGGFAAGLVELRRTIASQRRAPMSRAMFERFTGVWHARGAIERAWRAARFSTATVVDEGKNAWAVRRALEEVGVRVVARDGERAVIGTLSPGPMLDAYQRRRWGGAAGPPVVAPWIAADGVHHWPVHRALTGESARVA